MFSSCFDSFVGPTPGGKTDVAKAAKKRGNAQKDASNSRKPSVLHSVEKDSSVNEKDRRAVKK